MTGLMQYIRSMIQEAAQQKEGLNLTAEEVSNLAKAFDQLHDARQALAEIAAYSSGASGLMAREALKKMTL